MNTLHRPLALLLALAFGWSALAQAAVLPADATNLRRVSIMRNVSGSTLTSHSAVILQNSSSDSNVLVGGADGQESSLGLDVTTTTSADQGTFVGCTLDDVAQDDGLVRVVTWGPAICRWAGSTDNTNTRMAQAGTTTIAGMLGSGTLAGLVMSLDLNGTSDAEANGTEDNSLRWIWISPDNN